MQVVLERVRELHSQLQENLTWYDVAKYGGIAISSWGFYAFAIKPFLSPLRKMPGPGYNPIFGNVRSAMIGEAMDTSVELLKKYGEVVHFYMLLGQDSVLVGGPKALKYVLVENEENYQRGDGVAPGIIDGGIFFVIGDEHKYLRRILNPFFGHSSVQSYLEVFEEHGFKLVDYWSAKMKGSSADLGVQDDFKRLALDVICVTVFGYQVDNLENIHSEFAQAFGVIVNITNLSFFNLLPFASSIPTASNRKIWKSLAIVDKVIYEMIRERRELAKQDNQDSKHDLLSSLMSAVDEETGQGMSDKWLRNQVLSLLIAGHETTSVTMSWILLTMAQNPDVQEKVRQEAVEFLPPRNQTITWEHIDKMVYSTAVLKEVQRLYPAAPSMTRRAKKDDHIGGYFIPKGTNIICHLGAMMRDPSLWKNPTKFDPSRFLGDSTYDNYSHMPFATGPHKCLGHQFAKMQLRLLMPILMREFRFCMIPGSHFKRKTQITLCPSPNLQLNVQCIN